MKRNKMKCQKARKLLYLHAGHDLPEREKVILFSHLKQCPDCQSLLGEIKRSRENVKTIAGIDLPDKLSPDFSQNTTQQIADENGSQPGFQSRPKSLFRLRPYLASGILVLGVILVASLMIFISRPGEISPERLLKEMQRLSAKGVSELEWDSRNVFSVAFTGPFQLDRWDAPKQAGVYTIMHKAGAGGKPDSYVIDYCGQGRNLSLYKSYPWIHHRKKNLISQAGSLENVYIAVFLMPGSSNLDRQRIKKAFIQTFDPEFNKGV
jgi:hypothetical protein